MMEKEVEKIISKLRPYQEEACNELAEHIRLMVKVAGSPVGELAIALVWAELREQSLSNITQ